MKAGDICYKRLGFVLDMKGLMCLLGIQMETSIRKLDRSLEEEGRGHTGEEYFQGTSGLV